MAWTYTNNPAGVPRDAVRLLIGDTDINEQLLSDEEIGFFLTEQGGNEYLAAAEAARAIAGKFARDADRRVGDMQTDASQRAQAYRDLANDLLGRARTLSTPTPYAGGIEVADKEANENDTTVVPPSFTKGMHDDRAARARVDDDLGEDDV